MPGISIMLRAILKSRPRSKKQQKLFKKFFCTFIVCVFLILLICLFAVIKQILEILLITNDTKVKNRINKYSFINKIKTKKKHLYKNSLLGTMNGKEILPIKDGCLKEEKGDDYNDCSMQFEFGTL